MLKQRIFQSGAIGVCVAALYAIVRMEADEILTPTLAAVFVAVIILIAVLLIVIPAVMLAGHYRLTCPECERDLPRREYWEHLQRYHPQFYRQDWEAFKEEQRDAWQTLTSVTVLSVLLALGLPFVFSWLEGAALIDSTFKLSPVIRQVIGGATVIATFVYPLGTRNPSVHPIIRKWTTWQAWSLVVAFWEAFIWLFIGV